MHNLIDMGIVINPDAQSLLEFAYERDPCMHELCFFWRKKVLIFYALGEVLGDNVQRRRRAIIGAKIVRQDAHFVAASKPGLS